MNFIKLAERAYKLLHQALPDLPIGNHLLLVPPAEHVLRCFVLETGLEIKGTAYFWRVLMPLYRRSGMLILNYGERLLAGERVSLEEPELDRTIDRLARTVSGGGLERLRAIETPEDFLRHVDWNACPATPNYRIDLALTHFMAGNPAACQEILDQLLAVPPNPRWDKELELARQLAQEVKSDRSALKARIMGWEQSAIRWLHLAPRARAKSRPVRCP